MTVHAPFPRRRFLIGLSTIPTFSIRAGSSEPTEAPYLKKLRQAGASAWIRPDRSVEWLERWEKGILADAKNRYCDREMGEELGWLVSPFLNGFYNGYTATGRLEWVERFIDWAEACLKRSVREPDGYEGWPKGDGGGGDSSEYSADSLLGEAMLFRPIVLMAQTIQRTPALRAAWGDVALRHLHLAERNFTKWDSRACWREVPGGGLWVVPAYGIDSRTGGWSAGYEHRQTTGFSNPANKQNHIARWLAALHDVTGKSIYRKRAEGWFRLMKSRIRPANDRRYEVWNYWDPAGPWDYRADGTPRHWVGVHPNGGYYAIDLEGIVTAFEHGWIFGRADLERLIATNRDSMWNQKIEGAAFRRIDGGEVDPRWKETPGMLWTALLPYDRTLRKIFVANHRPDSWGGLALTPWALAHVPG
jgi:hypothetical protein